MYEDQLGFSTVSSQSPDVRPYTLMEGPVMANSGTTENGRSDMHNNGTETIGGSATDSCGSTTSNAGPAANSSGTMVNVGSTTGSMYTMTNNGSATDDTDTMSNWNSATVSRGIMTNSGLETDNSDTTSNGDSTTSNIYPEAIEPISSSSKTTLNNLWFRHKEKHLEVLEQEFLRDPTPTLSKRREIAEFIQKKENQVKYWFQRRRKKQREDIRIPPKRGRKPKAQRNLPDSPETIATNHFVNLSPRKKPSVNLHYYPAPEQEVGVTKRDQTFVPNFYKDVREDGNVIPWQQQLINGPQVGGDTYYSPVNTGQSTNKLDLVSGQDVGYTIRNRTFFPNFHREGDGIPWQPPPPNGQQMERYSYCSPFNTGPNTNEQDPAGGQKVIVRDHSFATNYHKRLVGGEHGFQEQEQLYDDRHAEKDHYSSPINLDSSTMYYRVIGEDDETILRQQKFVPNFNKEVNFDGHRVPWQQLPESQQVERYLNHSLVNPSACTDSVDPVLGQNVDVKVVAGGDVQKDSFRHVEPTVKLPQWYQLPY